MSADNSYQLAHPYRDPRTGEVVLSDRNWIRATYYTGVSAFYQVTKAENILEQLIRWCEKHEWQVGTETYSMANRLTCTQTYLELYFSDPEPRMIKSVQEWVDTGLPGSPSSPDI
jgi:rhamnogalacturonyl hydrolase YesR